MSKQDYSYRTQEGNDIYMSLYGAEKLGKQPLVIFIHGFKGFKDWGFVPATGEYLAERGISLLTFNFSHNGIEGHGNTFTQLDKFKANSLSLEVNETLEIIKLCTESDYLGQRIDQPVGLIGHSRGGGIAILAADKSPKVAAVSTWASVSTFDRYNKQTKQAWKAKGYWEVKNSRTGQIMQLGTAMLSDIEKQTKHNLNILQAVKRLEKPFLIVHGQEDETVPFFDAEQLNIYGDPGQTIIRLIPHAGHTFGAAHPFSEASQELKIVWQLNEAFFTEILNPHFA